MRKGESSAVQMFIKHSQVYSSQNMCLSKRNKTIQMAKGAYLSAPRPSV
jgi:hypothetical protein